MERIAAITRRSQEKVLGVLGSLCDVRCKMRECPRGLARMREKRGYYAAERKAALMRGEFGSGHVPWMFSTSFCGTGSGSERLKLNLQM
jgi:hypothetical protein